MRQIAISVGFTVLLFISLFLVSAATFAGDPGDFGDGVSPVPGDFGDGVSGGATNIPPNFGTSPQSPVGDLGDGVINQGTQPTNTGGRQGTQPTNSGGGNSLTNPLKFKTISEFLVAVIDVILIFAVPIIVFFIIYAGFMYVTARGDTSKISTAHSALTWAVVGGVIALGAKLIVEVIKGTIAAF